MAIGDTCTVGRSASTLLVDSARLRAVAAVARVTGTERVALEDAAGRVLADAPVARTGLPPFDDSAKDGCARDISEVWNALECSAERSQKRSFLRRTSSCGKMALTRRVQYRNTVS